MPSPRLFGFRPAKKRTVDSVEASPLNDPIELLADKLFDIAREATKDAAWGISPAERYFQRRIDYHD